MAKKTPLTLNPLTFSVSLINQFSNFNKMKKELLILTLFLSLIPTASPIGIVSDYLEDSTLLLKPGESKIWGIRIQNPDKNEITIRVSYDNSYLSIIDHKESYTIPPKGKVSIDFNISAPKNGAPKEEFIAQYTIHQGGDANEGVGLNLNIAKGVRIKVIREEGKIYASDFKIFVPIAVILLGIVLTYRAFRKEPNKKKRKK